MGWLSLTKGLIKEFSQIFFIKWLSAKTPFLTLISSNNVRLHPTPLCGHGCPIRVVLC